MMKLRAKVARKLFGEYTCCRSFSDETLAYEYLTSHHDLLLIDESQSNDGHRILVKNENVRTF